MAQFVGLRHDFADVMFNRAQCQTLNYRHNSIYIVLMDRSLDEVISERQVKNRQIEHEHKIDVPQQRRAPRGRRDGRYNDSPREGVRKVCLYTCRSS